MPSFVHTAESGGHNKPMRKRANGKFQERIKQDHSNVTDKETAFTTEGEAQTNRMCWAATPAPPRIMRLRCRMRTICKCRG